MTVLSRREKQSYIEQALGKTEIKTILPIAPRSRAMRKAIRMDINKIAILLNIKNRLHYYFLVSILLDTKLSKFL